MDDVVRLESAQNLAIGATSVAMTTAFPDGVWYARLSSTGDCHVAIGEIPVATASDPLIKATDHPELIKVMPGEKIAVIQDASATGNLNITVISG